MRGICVVFQWFAAALAMVVAAAPAAAQTVYSDRATFTAATNTTTTILFDTAFEGSFTSHGPTYTVAGATFTDTEINTLDQAYLLLAAGTQYGSDYLQWQGSDPQVLTVSFASAVTAVGFDFMEVRANSIPFTFTISGNSTTVASGASPSFFGYTSNTPFSTLIISSPHSNSFFATLDNFQYGIAIGTVPEPTTWAMMLLGFAGIGVAMRRRQRALPTQRRTPQDCDGLATTA
jgi:hypothetical protein